MVSTKHERLPYFSKTLSHVSFQWETVRQTPKSITAFLGEWWIIISTQKWLTPHTHCVKQQSHNIFFNRHQDIKTPSPLTWKGPQAWPSQPPRRPRCRKRRWGSPRPLSRTGHFFQPGNQWYFFVILCFIWRSRWDTVGVISRHTFVLKKLEVRSP